MGLRRNKVSKLSGKTRPVVLITISRYLPLQGGGPIYFSTLIELLKDKVDFIVLTQQCEGTRTIEKKGNVWIYRLQPFMEDYPALAKYLFVAPITFLALAYFWAKHRPVIHSHSNGIYGFIPSLFSSIINKEMVKEVQDLSDPPFNLRAGRVGKYVVCSTTVEDRLAGIGISRKDILTYPALNPPETKKFYERYKKRKEERGKDGKDDRIKILFAGWLSRRVKGVDVLLEMFKIVQKELPEAKLIIIGDGPDKKYCEDFISANKLKNVKLMGNLSYEETLGHIAEAAMIVQPSNEEAFGRVIMEGYQFEKPVVAHSVGHIPKYIENGKNGILVPPGKPAEFAKAVIRLAGDKKLRAKLGKNGKKFLEEQPTWDDLAGDVYKIYKELWGK